MKKAFELALAAIRGLIDNWKYRKRVRATIVEELPEILDRRYLYVLGSGKPWYVQDVVGAALAQLGQTVRLRGISVVVAPDLPLIPMDSALIVQVIVNLLENAIKYSEAASPIGIEAHVAGDQLLLCVLDRGNGISEEERERVFEKFYRGTAAGGAKGAGLGLSICKGFIEAHSGRIWIEPRKQGGTAVKFTLPAEQKT